MARMTTVLERAIARVQHADVSADTVLWLAAAEILFLSDESPGGGPGLPTPVVLSREGANFLPVFTHADVAESLMQDARFVIGIQGFELLKRMPEDVGIVVNPGSRLGFEVPGQGLRAFILDVLGTDVAL